MSGRKDLVVGGLAWGEQSECLGLLPGFLLFLSLEKVLSA